MIPKDPLSGEGVKSLQAKARNLLVLTLNGVSSGKFRDNHLIDTAIEHQSNLSERHSQLKKFCFDF